MDLEFPDFFQGDSVVSERNPLEKDSTRQGSHYEHRTGKKSRSLDRAIFDIPITNNRQFSSIAWVLNGPKDKEKMLMMTRAWAPESMLLGGDWYGI